MNKKVANVEKKGVRIGILISGRGSNMEAIVRQSKQKDAGGSGMEVVCVLSDNPKAEGLKRAILMGVKAVKFLDAGGIKGKLHEQSEQNYVDCLKSYGVELVCFAGFMRMVGPIFLCSFGGWVLNIHPSLLPRHRGLGAIERALRSGDSHTGCTVHWVDRGMDTGQILGQQRVPILEGDTVERLTQRIHRAEHELYPRVLREVVALHPHPTSKHS